MAEVLCVGRELEQTRLRRHIDSAHAGVGGLVVVEGSAGVGKTTLGGWCLAVAARHGGSAHQVGALGPAIELPLGIWARLAASAAVEGRAVPPVLLDGEVEQLHPHDRYAAVLDLLRALGPRPVVLVIDDLHQADESSLLLLAQLAPVLAGTGVLVVGTSRGASSHPTDGGREMLESLAMWATRIDVPELDGAGVRAMAAATAGPGAADWARSVQPLLTQRSGGNPLVLRTMLDELGVADGARPSVDELAALPVEPAVGAVLARRLATLPPSTIEVLHAAAMLGGDVGREVLRDVVERDVDDDVARAIAVGALERVPDGSGAPDGELRFVHPAVSETVEARADDDPAVRHRRIAQWLRRRGRPQDLPMIAHHLAAASRIVPADDLAVAGVEAGVHALRVGDHAAAARSFDIALASGAVVDEVDLLLRSSSAHHGAGHREQGWERAWRAADRCGDDRPTDIARAALGFAVARDYSTDTSRAVELLRRALRVLDPSHPLRLEVLGALSTLEMSLPIRVEPAPFPGADEGLPPEGTSTVAWHWITRPEIARPLADEALALARASGDEELVARVAMCWRQSFCAPEHLSDRLAAVEHAMAHARRPEDRVLAVISAVLDHLEAGDRALVDAALAELVHLGDVTGDPAVRWRAAQLSAMVAFASGRPDDAERASAEAFGHGAQAGENGRFVVRGLQSAMLALEADPDPVPTVDFLLANIEELAYPPIRAGVVAVLADAGRRSDALRYLPDLLAHVVEDHGREASWLITSAFAADAVASLGLVDDAHRLLPVLLPFADRITVDGLGVHCHGCLARPLARLAHLVGDRALALALAEQAQARETAAGLHRFVLDGAVDALVMAPPGAGGGEEKGEAAARIASDARERGLVRTARRALDRLARGDAAVLSARQYDVLLALAEGLTYQAAGERLGFSHSTIRHEAMRVYALLGARDREEAVDVARARGMLPRG